MVFFDTIKHSSRAYSPAAQLFLRYTLHGEADTFTFLISFQYTDLYHISNLHHFTGMPKFPITNLRNMYQTILMDTNINKNAEVNHITNRSGKNHTGLKIFYLQYIGAKDRRR